METKICPRCGIEQSILEFDRYKHCRLCHNKDVKEYSESNREKVREQNRISYHKHREARREYRRKYYSINHVEMNRKTQERHPGCSYNITSDEYNNLLKNQDECCAICGRNQKEFKKLLNIDHDHKTGKVRGLLCYSCNLTLGLMKDDINRLQLAINYLKQE